MTRLSAVGHGHVASPRPSRPAAGCRQPRRGRSRPDRAAEDLGALAPAARARRLHLPTPGSRSSAMPPGSATNGAAKTGVSRPGCPNPRVTTPTRSCGPPCPGADTSTYLLQSDTGRLLGIGNAGHGTTVKLYGVDNPVAPTLLATAKLAGGGSAAGNARTPCSIGVRDGCSFFRRTTGKSGSPPSAETP